MLLNPAGKISLDHPRGICLPLEPRKNCRCPNLKMQASRPALTRSAQQAAPIKPRSPAK
jgi:hypothetical protein